MVDEDEGQDLDDDYVVYRVFESMYPGRCTVDWDHKIKPGMKVGKVKHSTNPFIPVPGVCCDKCLRFLPRER